ncbi:MAG: Fe-Mn family superoxide dismutase [Acidobacteriia bacterium]|nr:Fe-Mn family superoxide dismutase [Terriglobia bacterium]
MTVTAKNFDHLLGKLEGLSEKQLKAHFGLYQGYVKKLNEIQEKLKSIDRSTANYSFSEYSELKRREAVAFNGAFLHEMYFENLSAKGGEPSNELADAIKKSFGSRDAWTTDLKAAGASTPGWVILTYNRTDHELHHYILFEHHIGYPVRQEPLLALDCWEHAYMIDYGTTKGDYLSAFIKHIDWNVVNKRFAALDKAASAAR